MTTKHFEDGGKFFRTYGSRVGALVRYFGNGNEDGYAGGMMEIPGPAHPAAEPMADEMEGQSVYGEAGEIIGGSLDGAEEGLGAGAHIIIEASIQVGLGWPGRKAWA